MNYIDLEIYYEYLDDELTETNRELKYKGMFKSQIFNEEDERDLFQEVMMAKNDGMTLDIRSLGNYHIIIVSLMYSIDEDVGSKLVNVICDWCENRFEILDPINDALEINNIDITDNGILVSFEYIFDTNFLPKLAELLTANNLEYQIVEHSKHSFERGAGDYHEQLLLFIKSTIESGITWDIIKDVFNRLITKFGFEQNKIAISRSFDTEQLILAVSEKINENAINIRITNISRDLETGNIYIELKTRYSSISVTCDDKNNIIEFHHEDRTQTRI